MTLGGRCLKTFSILFLLVVFFNGSARAQLSYNRDQKLSVLSLGAGTLSVSSSETNFQTVSIFAAYRRALSDSPISFSVQINPIFQTSSLFGLQASGSLAYQIVGSNEIATNYSDQGQVVLSQSTHDDHLKMFLGAGATILPVFGSNSTASYSGPFGELAALYMPLSLGASLQYNKLALGERNVSMMGLFVSYFWNMH
jgi:hypothetical protein